MANGTSGPSGPQQTQSRALALEGSAKRRQLGPPPALGLRLWGFDHAPGAGQIAVSKTKAWPVFSPAPRPGQGPLAGTGLVKPGGGH